MGTKLIPVALAALLGAAAVVVAVASPGERSDTPSGTGVLSHGLEPSGLSEPPVIDDGDGGDDSDSEEEPEAAQGTEKVAAAIAGEFGVPLDEVLARHADGIGFGALFKLYAIARAKGIALDELLATIEEDGGGYGFGNLRKGLSEEEQEALEEGPKNLGQLVSESKKNKEHGNPHD
jgi:hypothetical protein